MNRADVKKVLDGLLFNDLKSNNEKLINLIEKLVDKVEALEENLQKSADEITRLKGEKGKPKFRKQTNADDGTASNTNHSSEEYRKERGDKPPRQPKSKKKGILHIDRTIIVEFDKDNLPGDVIFKGYETRVIQDLKIVTDNIEFKLPCYYSPSLKKSFIADLPKGYQGEFGPGIRALIITLYRDSGMTQPALDRFFQTFNIHIAKSTLSKMITEGHELFHQEKEDIITAGIKMHPYQHIDDTSCRVNGKNHYTHVLCNPFFTAYFTRAHKDRLTILEFLCRGVLKFKLDDFTYEILKEFRLSEKLITDLKNIACDDLMTRNELDDILMRVFTDPMKYLATRHLIRESSAIAYYHGTTYAIEHLVCDDAKQFNNIGKNKALCWVHEGRHYKKLSPVYEEHRKVLDNFIGEFWDYYHALRGYQKNPSEILAKELAERFDELFSQETCYIALNERIALSFSKKESLLTVLKFPFVLLHNNPAELGARVQARMRDINLQTISENGTKTKDTFATLVQTARKLGVNLFNYVYDRVTEKFEMPSLANLIVERSTNLPNTA